MHYFKHLPVLTHLTPIHPMRQTNFIPILQMNKLRHRKILKLAHSYTVSKWMRQDLNPTPTIY